MVILYKCPRCNYETDRKYNMNKHIEKKKLCKPIILDINLQQYKSIILKENDIVDNIKKLDKLEKLEKIEKLEKSVLNINMNNINSNNNNVNNNITNNITINLNSYDNPEMGYITEKDVTKCLKVLETSMLDIAKKLYFNPDHPENKSIYKTTMKNKLIKYFKDNEWNVGDQNIVINTMIDNIKDAMDQGISDDNENKYYDLNHKYDTDKKFKHNVDRSIIAECYNNKPKK